VTTDQTMRRRVLDAAIRLRDDEAAVTAAMRELVATGAHGTLADARRTIGLAATRCTQRLGA
jgi:hypothetical protein